MPVKDGRGRVCAPASKGKGKQVQSNSFEPPSVWAPAGRYHPLQGKEDVSLDPSRKLSVTYPVVCLLVDYGPNQVDNQDWLSQFHSVG